MLVRYCTRAVVVFALCIGSAGADDTDIYIRPSTSPGAEPMVMFSLDYRANLTSVVCSDVRAEACTAAAYFRAAGLGTDVPADGALRLFDVLRLSLKVVLAEVDGVKVGLMLSHADSGRCGGTGRCSNGGAILMGFESLLPNDANGARARLHRKLDALDALKSRANSPDHPYQGKELFFELFRYLTGQGVHHGDDGWIDFEQGRSVDETSNMACADADPLRAEACYDGAIIADDRYRSPLPTAAACTRIFTVNFMFQVSQQDDDSDDAIAASAEAGGLPGIRLAGNDGGFDTVLAHLHQRDLAPQLDGVQNLTSYFIVPPQQINRTTNGYAKAGGTDRALPMAEDPALLVDTLRRIFRQILSVSTTFVAASMPVNVFNRASVLEDVYIALFQADAQARPFWSGNLKKLKLRETVLADGSRDARLYDARGEDAVAPDGRIETDALTWWTDAGALSDEAPDRQIFAARDGRHVDRGGAGQKIPGFLSSTAALRNGAPGARRLYYDGDGTLGSLDADAETAAALRAELGASSDDEALTTLRWIRGVDVDGDDAAAARPWLMGDPLHSRPLPINYGARSGHDENNPAIFIAVGTNDGFLRFIRNTSVDGAELGEEIWAFMPRKAMGIQQTLRANTAGSRHPYGVDGSPVAYRDESSGETYLYFGMRRGGDAYYALDVSDPLDPQLMWTIDSGTEGYDELGLTFSTPRPGRIRGSNGSTRPVLVFAGGYDPKKDYENPPTPDRKGRALYVADARTGELIWKAMHGSSTGVVDGSSFAHADLQDSIPADVVVADTDGDGFSDRVIVGDSGGRVWRADLAGPVRDWTLSLLADLGYHDSAGRDDDRRFFHAADLVQSRDANGPYDAVLIGSGDRENPLDYNGSAPTNYFYLIKDRQTAPGTGRNLSRSHDALADITGVECLIRASAQACEIDLALGWKLRLGTAGGGEKALAAPVSFGGTVYFTTYLPPGGADAASCGPAEGGGRLYAVALADGAPAFNFNRTDDAADDDSGLPNSLADRSDGLASGGIPAEVVFLPLGDAGLSYIRPDLDIERPPRSNRFRTWWQRSE